MENDNWAAALDVDDSDLAPRTLLRPCSNSNSNKHNPNPTPALISPRSIPGPAGKVQAAMNRKRLHHSDPPVPQCPQLSYQDDDDDFKTNTWLRALDFHQTPQTTDFLIPTTPLNRIHNSMPDAIVNKVVALINSCTPNGLGDMTVTLKDPTGIIDGTIHRKVLTESKFAKDISVKAAIILKKVSIFAPSSKTVYLNITRSNVLKVYRKDVAPLADLSPDISKKSRILEDKFAQKQGRTEETMHEVCQVTTPGRSWLLSNQNKNGLSFPATGNEVISIDKNTGTQNKALWARQRLTATEIYNEAGVHVAGDNQVTLDSNEKQPTSENLSEGHKSSVFVGNLNGDHGEEVQQVDKAVKQRSISKVSRPQWTDEQLSELFDGDDDPLF